MAGPQTPDFPAHRTPAQRRKKDGERQSNQASPRNVEGRSGESRRVSEAESAGPTRQQCGECLGAVAHRLSQPLTALRGSLELALRTELSAQESRAALEQAFELTELIVQLIRSLRELAEAARADVPPKLLSLRDLVQETVEELKGLADSRGITTVFETSHEAIVSAPPDRLRELVAKLLWLVIQRSPDRGDIGLAVSGQPTGASVGLLIADQGPSPGPGEFDFASGGTAGLGRLFAEAAKNRCLDWSIVRVLAESLGGTLEVKPRKSQGCCFILQLPLASAPE